MFLDQSSTHRSSRRWTLAFTSLAFFMVALDALIVITALPAMQVTAREAVQVPAADAGLQRRGGDGQLR